MLERYDLLTGHHMGRKLMMGKQRPGMASYFLLGLIGSISGLGHCDFQYGYDVKVWTESAVVNTTVPQTPTGWIPVSPGSTFYQSRDVFCLVPEECGEGIQISALLSSSNANLTTQSDPQYGYTQLGFVGFDGFQFMFWLTNTKVYALYARLPHSQTPLEYYTSAVYLIPIADRQPERTDLYELWLDASSKLVSWRMNGWELLKINPAGADAVDSKFMIADYGGYFDYPGFPEQGVAVIGAGIPPRQIYRGQPNTACEGTLFNQCCDSLSNAKTSQCVYSPFQAAVPAARIQAIYMDLSVSVRRRIETCPPWTCELRNMDCQEIGTSTAIECGSPESPPVCMPVAPYAPAERLGWQKPRIAAPFRIKKI